MGWFAYDLQMFAQWDNLFFGFTTVYQGFFFKKIGSQNKPAHNIT